MKETRASIRYAKALLGLAIEKNVVENVYRDMLKLQETVQVSKEFLMFLKSPVIKRDKKLKVVEQLFQKDFSLISYQFIQIVINKGREAIIGDMASSFVEEYKNHKNIVTAQVTTAIALDESTRNKIATLLNVDQHMIDIQEVIDETIMGGFIVKVKDRQIDESIKGKLTKLKQEFSQNLYESKL